MKTKLKKGDLVKVIAGKQKDEQGKIIEVIRGGEDGSDWRVRIEGVKKIKRHIKPQKSAKHPEGGIVEDFGSIHISNVMLLSESLGRPVRTGAVKTADGKKQRVARGRGIKATNV